MRTHFYLSISPIEALIASQLDPEQFGQYMAIGAGNGSYERIMFAEIDGGFGDHFDWQYAAERCVAHTSGEPKHSLWMSVYRVLEHVPLDRLQQLYLTTKDGRSLPLDPTTVPPAGRRSFYVYQELAPLTPLVVSSLPPAEFGRYLTSPDQHVSVPTVVFTDLKVVDFDNPEITGNIGGAYDHNLEHLRACVGAVLNDGGKPNKNVERSVASFSYQIIGDGIYIGNGDNLVFYPMPDSATIRQNHYDWGRSAMII
jgi:hypothetical protein